MIHRYVRLKNEVVTKFHLVAEEVIKSENGEIDESLGAVFLAELHGDVPENFIKCERDDDPRGKVIRVGYIYHRSEDLFKPLKPFDSWIFNPESWDWDSPKPRPEDGNVYFWSEPDLDWLVAELPE